MVSVFNCVRDVGGSLFNKIIKSGVEVVKLKWELKIIVILYLFIVSLKML